MNYYNLIIVYQSDMILVYEYQKQNINWFDMLLKIYKQIYRYISY
jgi:hypothetical protein